MSPRGTSRLLALVTEGLRGMRAYHVPRPPAIRAKLDANELPYGLPPELADALAAELAKVPLERYPASDGGELRPVVAAMLGVDPATVVLGNGSDELIAMLCAAFAAPRAGAARATVLYPVPTFVVYRIASLTHGCEPVEVALRDDFTLDEEAVERAFVERRPNLAFFALPNNPTGTLWSPDFVLALARRYPDTIVIADEAYGDYGGQTLLPYVGMPVNLVVMRTLSKVGLAGLRVGFLTADLALVGELEKVRPPYNLGSLNQRAAAWLLANHGPALRARIRAVVDERARLAAALGAIDGVRVFPSEANLILIRIGQPGDGAAGRVWQALAARGVLVRNLDVPGPTAGCLRVTIGTPAENDLLLAELPTALSASR